MFRNVFSFLCCSALAISATVGFAQETEQPVKKTETKVSLDQDGNLSGNVFAKVDGQKKPVEAKVTLSNLSLIHI